MRDSVILHLGHLEIFVQSYSDLLNVDTFHYTGSKKITFVNTTTGLIRKVLKWEVVEVIVIDTSFPKSSFSLESFDFYHC